MKSEHNSIIKRETPNSIKFFNKNKNKNEKSLSEEIKVNFITENNDNNDILDNISLASSTKSKYSINIIIEYNLFDKSKSKIEFAEVNQSITVKSLKIQFKNEVQKILDESGSDIKYKINKITFLIPGQIMSNDKTLLCYHLKNYNYKIRGIISYYEIKNNNYYISNNHFNEDNKKKYEPKFKKTGYKIEPNIFEIFRNDYSKLGELEGLKISNKYGQIEILDKVNLLGTDFTDFVDISEKGIDTSGIFDKVKCRYCLKNFENKSVLKFKNELMKSFGKNILEFGYDNDSHSIYWVYDPKIKKDIF
jgi:hypothetical protein